MVACGIANPGRFVADVRDAGYTITREVVFPDHHAFSPRDVAAIAGAATDSGAVAVLTTDKDAIRFEAAGPRPFALYRVPLTLNFTPPGMLFDSVAAVLDAHAGRVPTLGGELPASGPVSGKPARVDQGSRS